MTEWRKIWERLHGPVPKGWIIVFLNGHKGDNRPENLAALSREGSLGLIVSPFQSRIRKLERQLKLLENNKES